MVVSPESVNDRKISVVIPTRNRSTLLDAAIRSVLRSPLVTSSQQIVVVDDDSHDQTEAVARQHGVTYLRVSFHDTGLSRNAGLAVTKSTYVAFLDDDDVWLPGNMEPQLAALEEHRAAAFSYGIARCATEDLHPLPWTFPSPPLVSGMAPDRLHLGYPNVGVVLFRWEALFEVGGFDPHVDYYQDADLMIRLAARHEIVGVEFVGMLYRFRAPSKERADYFWAHRHVARWRPKHVGVGLKATVRFQWKIRRMVYHIFCEDAAACVALGHRRDALQCLFRALWISPARAVRHVPTVVPVFLAMFQRGR